MRGEHTVGAGKKRQETASLKGGLTWGTTRDPYRAGNGQQMKSRRANAEPGHGAGGGGGWADPTLYKRKRAVEAQIGRKLTLDEFRQPEFWVAPPADAFSKAGRTITAQSGLALGTQAWVQAKIAEGDNEGGMAGEQSGTSIFDPVLCELAYRWFCPPGGLVLDPFAGGSVRGIVASKLGRQYVGVDLRPEQIAANEAQGAALCDAETMPRWLVGDSTGIDKLAAGVSADFVLVARPMPILSATATIRAISRPWTTPTSARLYRPSSRNPAAC